MKILFLVQAEGRGHLTQAIALGQILRNAGHELVGAMAGTSQQRKIPSFFEEQIHCPVYHFDAPDIVYNARGKGMNVGKTILKSLLNLPKYLQSLSNINQVVKEIQPDVIVSFYELHGGLYNTFYRSKIPMICIAHQYLLLHPGFTFPARRGISRILINANSRITSLFSAKKLALSFRYLPDVEACKIAVVPPLLRREIQQLHVVEGKFLLVYMTHHSLSEQVIAWHRHHPDIQLHCFWDNREASEEFKFDETLTFHQINSEKYLKFLAGCQALVTTAGFESVCEAMYLGKPVMMVPVPNHYEQECNAVDGVISGAGVMSKTFDLSVMLNYLPTHQDQSLKFRNWYKQGETMFLNEIAKFEKVNKQKPAQKSVKSS